MGAAHARIDCCAHCRPAAAAEGVALRELAAGGPPATAGGVAAAARGTGVAHPRGRRSEATGPACWRGAAAAGRRYAARQESTTP
ncbi:MAG TPA: hypothetical protein VF100_01365 [Thermoanaerobaculia bacterium]